MKECHSLELKHDSNSDDEIEVLGYMNFTINNDEYSGFAKLCILNPPIDYYFSCANFYVDEISDSDATITCNDMGYEVTEEPPPPEPVPDCMPEITFTSTSTILQ